MTYLFLIISTIVIGICSSCNEANLNKNNKNENSVRDSIKDDSAFIKDTSHSLSTFEKDALQAIEIVYLGFRGKLIKKMRDKGVDQSMHQCRIDEIQQLNSFIQKHHFKIERITESSDSIINYFKKNQSNSSRTIIDQEDSIFYKPIRIRESICLSCHGKPYLDVNAKTIEKIKLNYTSLPYRYSMNDIMGVWKVSK